MNIFEEIKKDLSKATSNALKGKQTNKEYIKVVIAEIQRKCGKTPSNEEVIAVLKSLEKTATLNKEFDEIMYLSLYLPTLMSEDEVREKVQGLINNGANNIGMIMKVFNFTYKGQADNKLVSSIAKELL